MSEKVIIIGASGHGKVIADIIIKSGDQIMGFLDNDVQKENIMGFPVLGNRELIEKYKNHYFVIAIGDNKTRENFAEKYSNLNYYTAIHPTAVIGADVSIGQGTCIMANAVINASTQIGKHCIINTGAIIEHDNQIDDYVHISPNATLAGTVKVGKATHIGVGVTVNNNVLIMQKCVIGAGSVVVKNIEQSGTYTGIPAKRIG